MKITANKFVSVIYDLNVGEGDDRELMEQATPDAPMNFVFGTGSMLPAFEDELKGRKAGDTFKFTLPPTDAYGEYNEEYLMELPKNVFEVDGEFDSDMVREGNTVPMIDSDGNRLNGSVMVVKEDTVMLDFNHPLAGETLHFSGRVIDVHEPTEEDLESLSAGRCNCGCGDDNCDACLGCR
ncbi:MAG: FKBP-type peptidyl-prolyl cis-trans isomerase [Tannerellaceae bacterium]|jgi:FKBP-type peptidyl-prolyl cis-trans isomerase SlyD|nr:FKBP-type peptidyl-prolyl cis-trans isomerase [Tannerellaceae bacterium]